MVVAPLALARPGFKKFPKKIPLFFCTNLYLLNRSSKTAGRGTAAVVPSRICLVSSVFFFLRKASLSLGWGWVAGEKIEKNYFRPFCKSKIYEWGKNFRSAREDDNMITFLIDWHVGTCQSLALKTESRLVMVGWRRAIVLFWHQCCGTGTVNLKYQYHCKRE